MSELKPLPDPFDYCYEWDSPFGTVRKFSQAPHNGQGPDRSVTLFTADQMHAYALENRRAQPATDKQQAAIDNAAAFARGHDAGWASHELHVSLQKADAAPSVAPAPEPVAWQMIDKHGDTVYVPVTHAIKPDLVLDCDLRHPDNAPHEQRPLFAHPPRAPLTEEQRRDLVKECGLDWQRGYMPLFEGDPTNRYAVLVEAVEAAHGIGGK